MYTFNKFTIMKAQMLTRSKILTHKSYEFHNFFFLKLEFTPCKAEEPLQGTELQEKETQKD